MLNANSKIWWLLQYTRHIHKPLVETPMSTNPTWCTGFNDMHGELFVFTHLQYLLVMLNLGNFNFHLDRVYRLQRHAYWIVISHDLFLEWPRQTPNRHHTQSICTGAWKMGYAKAVWWMHKGT